MNIASQVLSAGADSATAIIHGSARVTYAALRQHVNSCAARLLATGAKKGDRIGILAENSLFFVVAYLGIIRAGLVAVPLQTESNLETISRILLEAGATQLLASNRLLRRLPNKGVLQEVTVHGENLLAGDGPRRELAAADRPPRPSSGHALPQLSGGEGRARGQGARESVPIPQVAVPGETDFPAIEEQRDLAALMYTSGSTGAPKGVMITHRNIATNTRDIVGYLGLTTADRAMVVLPFHYCYGLSLLHTHLAAGASVVISNQFLYPEQVLQEMQQQQCTGLAGVPSTYQILLRKTRFKRMEFPSLRWFQQAGGKLHNAYIEEILAAFPAVRFYLMYGQTEGTARLSYLPPDRLRDKLGSIGRGLPSTRLQVLRPDGTTVAPGSGEIGEIVAEGENIARGYWGDLEETARYFRNGQLHTGDLARVDADGFIYIVEREREMIKSGGNRVGAKEVEDVIAELPDVVEVAVVGVPHEILGEAITAFAVPVPGSTLSPDQVRDHCQRRLPAFKVPEQVKILPRLPHNANGKVVKSELRGLLTDNG